MSVQQLLERPGGLFLADCRFDLAAPSAGRESFLRGHIPGAVHVDLDADLSHGPAPLCGGRHPLPQPAWLCSRLHRLGIDAGSTVIAYDASGGCFAARLWWILRWLGHDRVHVLDGGWQAWLEAGRPVEVGDVEPSMGGAWLLHPRQALLASSAELLARAATPAPPVLVDAREPERFAGIREPIDPVAGHIPGARSRPWKQNLDAQLHFRPAEDLAAAWDALATEDADVVCYCGSGVTACHNVLAAVHAGRPFPRLYAGSWSEWITLPGAGIATAPTTSGGA